MRSVDISRYSHLKFHDLEKVGQGYDIQYLQFDGKYMTFCLMIIVMFALSLTIYEIFAKQEKCQPWEEGKG